MNLVIGVVGMLVLAGLYVGLALADRGRSGCGGCALMDLEEACGGCSTARSRDAGGPGRAGGDGPGRTGADPEWKPRPWTDDEEAGWSPDRDAGPWPGADEEWKR